MVRAPFAAYSYVLSDFLGGDVNVTDEDGDTPLYVVESIETARFLVERGATVSRQNADGLSVSAPPSCPRPRTQVDALV